MEHTPRKGNGKSHTYTLFSREKFTHSLECDYSRHCQNGVEEKRGRGRRVDQTDVARLLGQTQLTMSTGTLQSNFKVPRDL